MKTRTWTLIFLTCALSASFGCADKIPRYEDASVPGDASSAEDAGQPEDTQDAAPSSTDASETEDAAADAGTVSDGSVVLLEEGNLYPASSGQSAGKYTLRGHLTSNAQEATNGRLRMRGAFVPLQH